MPTPHITEDQLDQYAMGNLPEESIAEIEEHLLACSSCQNRLAETDEFLMVFRSASTQDLHSARQPKRFFAFRLGLGASAVGVAALVVLMIVREPQHSPRLPATVLMQSLRGPEVQENVAARGPYVLVFDLAIPTIRVPYEIEIVDVVGNEVLRKPPEIRDGRLAAFVDKLAPGSYWVRVYRKEFEKELVAEYGLRAE
jgi:hypothetical protein